MKLNEVSVERDTTRIKIDRDRTVKAASVEGYNITPGKVGGSFWGNNKLTSLQGAPEKEGEFSWQGAPEKVGGGFSYSNNQLTSLQGAPQRSKPKLMIKCGNCGGEFKTRKYAPVVSLNNELAAPCPHCGYWNLLNLHWDK